MKKIISVFLFVFSFFTFSENLSLNKNLLESSGVVRVYLKLQPDQEKSSFYGTGFFISKDTFITAFHVIERLTTLDLSQPLKDVLFFTEGNTEKRLAVEEIIAISATDDIAVIRTLPDKNRKFYPIDFQKLTQTFPLESMILGFPKEANHQFSSILTTLVKLDHNQRIHATKPYPYLLQGASGSPVIANSVLQGMLVISGSFFCEILSVRKIQEIIDEDRISCDSVSCIQDARLNLIKLARDGNANAQNHLGEKYVSRPNVPEEYYQVAVQWWIQAALQNHATALYHLGVSYGGGFGVNQDPEKARRFYQLASERGSTDAMYNLAVGYFYSLSDADHSLAFYWMEKSSSKVS